MQERDNEIVPVRPRRPRRSRPVIIVILLAAAAAVLLALRPWAHARPSADAGTGSGESTDAVEELLGRLAAQITDGMAVNECGPEYASELRSLAREKAEYARQLNFMAEHLEIYPEAAVKAALQGDEKVNFALQIPFRAPDSSGLGEQLTVAPGEIPYLTQYDERWGYHSYGSSVIGITGCGPTCLAMAAAGLTGNTSWQPGAGGRLRHGGRVLYGRHRHHVVAFHRGRGQLRPHRHGAASRRERHAKQPGLRRGHRRQHAPRRFHAERALHRHLRIRPGRLPRPRSQQPSSQQPQLEL